jgi:DNA segregation ATPase FtsK/SpoIIIE-like protein
MYTLEKLNKEVEIRLKLFKEEGVRTLEEYEDI